MMRPRLRLQTAGMGRLSLGSSNLANLLASVQGTLPPPTAQPVNSLRVSAQKRDQKTLNNLFHMRFC